MGTPVTRAASACDVIHETEVVDVTAVMPRPEVVEANSDDLRAAVKSAEKRAGFSYSQLADQANSGRFASIRARLAWVAIGDLGKYAH